MSTKIDSYQSLAPRPVAASGAAAKTAAAGNGSDGKAVAAVSASDSVRLTGDAVQLQQLDKSGKSAQPSDQSKVDRIKQAVDSGRYQVDAKSVALKLTRLDYALGAA